MYKSTIPSLLFFLQLIIGTLFYILIAHIQFMQHDFKNQQSLIINYSISRMILRDGIDDNTATKNNHLRKVQEYKPFPPPPMRTRTLKERREAAKTVKGLPLTILKFLESTKVVDQKKFDEMKNEVKNKWTPPPRLPVQREAGINYNKAADYKPMNPPLEKNIVFKAIGIRAGDGQYNDLLGLIPDAETSAQDSNGNTWVTNWPFARVALTARDAVNSRMRTLNNGNTHSILITVNLDRYNKWRKNSKWPRLQVMNFHGGYHIITDNVRSLQNFQVPWWFLKVKGIETKLLKQIQPIIGKGDTQRKDEIRRYVEEYNKKADTECDSKYEVGSMYYRWCMDQGNFVGSMFGV